jgi:hypothetical protein
VKEISQEKVKKIHFYHNFYIKIFTNKEHHS